MQNLKKTQPPLDCLWILFQGEIRLFVHLVRLLVNHYEGLLDLLHGPPGIFRQVQGFDVGIIEGPAQNRYGNRTRQHQYGGGQGGEGKEQFTGFQVKSPREKSDAAATARRIVGYITRRHHSTGLWEKQGVGEGQGILAEIQGAHPCRGVQHFRRVKFEWVSARLPGRPWPFRKANRYLGKSHLTFA